MKLARRLWIPLLLVAVALAARLLMVLTSVYLWDEDREWIRLANTISMDHLPLRGVTHPILPAYFIHLGSLVLGANFLGYRVLSVVAGVLTVLAGYRIVERRAGTLGGAVAAAALALNEYHVMVSSVAVDMVFYLLFSVLALGAFLRFLEEPRASSLLLTGLLTGLGFLCNERAGLLVPLWCVALLLTGNARWLLRWPTWAALAIFVACFLAAKTQAGAGGQLDRFAGFGVTAQPLAFYGKSAVRKLLSLAHTGFRDWAPEYPSMNALLGTALLAATALALVFKRLRDDPSVRTCLALFLLVMALLVFVDTRYNEEANLAPQAWYWADLSLLPAALLAGISAGRGGLAGRMVAAGVLGGALLGGVHVAWTRLGTSTVQGGAVPGLISPADGRMEELRTGFLTCAACPQDPAIALKKIEVRQEGEGWRPAAAEEAVAHDPAGRAVALRATPGNVYALWYDVGGRELAFDVVVREAPSRYPPPFWLAAATARGAPSPPRAGGS
ncbi:MAG TPA: glycosyltransferase family 39 protein [Candidatus Polarisedimenticolaceae bacterium]|nr:glycosyltransferase family 39 protein [Candidatus Polarisedimenticolaceae bacterium]